MRTKLHWAALLACLLLPFSSVSGQSNKGSIDLTATIAPSGARPEPVRMFTFYLLTKSFAEIQKEALGPEGLPTQDEFIDGLDASPQLRAWLKEHKTIDLATPDFDKMVTTDDIMNTPEFLAAYVRTNGGGVTNGFPQPKYKESDKEANPEQFEKLRADYLAALRKFLDGHKTSLQGIETELVNQNPKIKWDKLVSDHRNKVTEDSPVLAQEKYVAAKMDTDLDGRASLIGVTPGQYWISTIGMDAAAGDKRLVWDVPVRVTAGQTTRVDLSNRNGMDPRSSQP